VLIDHLVLKHFVSGPPAIAQLSGEFASSSWRLAWQKVERVDPYHSRGALRLVISAMGWLQVVGSLKL